MERLLITVVSFSRLHYSAGGSRVSVALARTEGGE